MTAMLRIGNISGFPSAAHVLELDLEAALRAVGLSPSVFDHPETLVPYVAVGELFRLAARRSGCEHVGLLVGMGHPDMGLPGFLMQHAPTARVGLDTFVRSLNRVDTGATVGLRSEADIATLSYSVTTVGVPTDHICDAAVAIGYGILKRMLDTFDPIEIRLPRRTPSNLAPYRAFFSKGRLKFNAHEAAIDFPESALDEPVKNADPVLYRYLQHVLARDSAGQDSSIADQIRRILPNLIRDRPVNSATVAQMFGVHPRTIARRLAEENVTLHELIQEARFEITQQLLRATNMSLTEIAAGLHYSDASAFTRAFRRKFGRSPSTWRRECRTAE